MPIQLKRVYDPPAPTDGYRILVDRLWPRGIKKSDLVLDEWGKDVAPSADLRRAWHTGHVSDQVFRNEYTKELSENPRVPDLAAIAQIGMLTLLFAAKDIDRSHAHVLADSIRTSL